MNIEDRLARLERENRRLKLVGLLTLAAIATVFIMGQARPSTSIEAENVFIKDRRGVTVASLGAIYEQGSDVGWGALTFGSVQDGSISAYLWNLNGEPQLRLGSESGGMVTATAARDGDTRVRVSGPGADGPQAQLRTLPGGSAAAVFVTDNQTTRATMQVSKGGSSMVWLMDANQQPVWTAP
jgi:hypothetical protein